MGGVRRHRGRAGAPQERVAGGEGGVGDLDGDLVGRLDGQVPAADVADLILAVGQDYNSLALGPAASSNGGSELSPGWRFNTGADVRLALGSGLVTYYDRSGAAWDFKQSGSVWNQPAGLDVALAYNTAPATWTVTDHETNEVLTFDNAGALVADSDRNKMPVTFSYEHQLSPTVRITGSAGYSTANSVVIGPGSDNLVHSFAQIPGDGTTARTTSFAYNTPADLGHRRGRRNHHLRL